MLADKVAELSDVQVARKTATAEFHAKEKKLRAEIYRLASDVRGGQNTLFASDAENGATTAGTVADAQFAEVDEQKGAAQ